MTQLSQPLGPATATEYSDQIRRKVTEKVNKGVLENLMLDGRVIGKTLPRTGFLDVSLLERHVANSLMHTVCSLGQKKFDNRAQL